MTPKDKAYQTLVQAFSQQLHTEHMSTCGPGQYSDYRFLLWVFQEYPTTAVETVLKIVETSIIVERSRSKS